MTAGMTIAARDRTGLDAALKALAVAEDALHELVQPYSAALAKIADSRAQLLALHGAEVLCRCDCCSTSILVGDPSHDQGDARLCIECAPTLGEALAGWQTSIACSAGAASVRHAAIASLEARIATEGPDAKAVWPPVSPPPAGLAEILHLEARARQEHLDRDRGHNTQVNAALFEPLDASTSREPKP